MNKHFIMLNDLELLDRIGERTREILKEELVLVKKENSKKAGNALLIKSEVCEMLRISQATLNRMVANGTLPCYKSGKKCVFKIKDVESTLTLLNI